METLNEFLDRVAIDLIRKMKSSFDTHDFIQQLLKDYELEYVNYLHSYNDKAGIFRTFHAQIGRYLSNNEIQLSIIKGVREFSENIKDYESENQKWSKR
jgi:hypothetical protein